MPTFGDFEPDRAPKWKPARTYSRKTRLLDQQNRPVARRFSRSGSAGHALEVLKLSPASPVGKLPGSESCGIARMSPSHNNQLGGDEDESRRPKEDQNEESSPNQQSRIPELHNKRIKGTQDTRDEAKMTPSPSLGDHPAVSSKKTTPQTTGKKVPRRQFLIFDKTPSKGYKIPQRRIGSNSKPAISKCTPGDGFSDDEAFPVGLFLSVKKRKPVIGSPGIGVLDLTQSVSSPVSKPSPMAAPKAKKIRRTEYDNSFLPDPKDFANPTGQPLSTQTPYEADCRVPSEHCHREPSPELGEMMHIHSAHIHSEDRASFPCSHEPAPNDDNKISLEQVPNSEYSSEVDDSQPEEMGSRDNVVDKGSQPSARDREPTTEPTTDSGSSIPETVDGQGIHDSAAQIDTSAEHKKTGHHDGLPDYLFDFVKGSDNGSLKPNSHGLPKSPPSLRRGRWHTVCETSPKDSNYELLTGFDEFLKEYWKKTSKLPEDYDRSRKEWERNVNGLPEGRPKGKTAHTGAQTSQSLLQRMKTG